MTDYLVMMHMRDRDAFYNAERLEDFLQSLVGEDFYVCSREEATTFRPLWREWSAALVGGTDLPASVHAGLSNQALAEVRSFCVEKKDLLILDVFSVATDIFSSNGIRLMAGFEWRLGFGPEQGLVYLAYVRRYFTLRQDDWEAYEHWLGIVQLTYRHWHPIYGYISDAMGGERETSYADILADKITYLYDLNLFSPEIVEALGRERVATVVAQRVIPLDDGGVLIVPTDNLLPGFLDFNYMDVARHLGLVAPTVS